MPITAGVIGCGNISRFHFSGLEKAGARIKWVCDLNEAAARPWAEKYGATYTADYHDLLADPEVNLVNVTPISAAPQRLPDWWAFWSPSPVCGWQPTSSRSSPSPWQKSSKRWR